MTSGPGENAARSVVSTGSTKTAAPEAKPKVRLAEATRLRLEGWSRAPIERHAATLAKVAGHKISLAAAIRDLLSRALRGQRPDEAYLSGYAAGFLAGYGDISARMHVGGCDERGGRIQPQRSRDNGDYHHQSDGAEEVEL